MMEVPWLTVILTTTVTYLIYWWAKKLANYWKEQSIPQEETLPLIGSMKDVILRRKTFTQTITDMYNKFDGEKFFGISIFITPVLVIRDIELVNNVLIKDFDVFTDRNHPLNEDLDLFNAALTSLTGEKWKNVRHKLTPNFSSGKMKLMFNKIRDCSEEAVLILKEKIGEDINSRDFLFKLMINTLGDVSFGIKVDAFNEEKEKENLFLYYSRRIFRPSMSQLLRLLLFLGAPKIMERFRITIGDKSTNNFFHKLVQDLISYRQAGDKNRIDFLQLMLNEKQKEINLQQSTPNDISNVQSEGLSNKTEEKEELSQLLSKRNHKNDTVFSDKIIAGQTLIFLSGGTETTAGVLSFALYELSVNGDIQKRAQKEIDSILETQDFNYEAVKKMTYLDQILNEVLRMRPPGAVLTRICSKDYKIPGDQFVIKKGTNVMIPVLGIHMNSQYFCDPEKFNPDRFHDMDAIPKSIFFPFGGGPRICIAMRLALLQMKIFLATVLSHYNVILSKKTKLPLKLDPRSPIQHVEGGLWIQFEQRCK